MRPHPQDSPETAATPPTGYEPAHVEIGVVAATGASGADVFTALPRARFNECYREALRASGKATRGSATLRLVIDADGQISEATAEVPERLRDIADCIVNAAKGHKVANVHGAGNAEIPLTFKIE
jgi:hypothetical protein